jgi:hypothetical protein
MGVLSFALSLLGAAAGWASIFGLWVLVLRFSRSASSAILGALA